MILMMMMPGPAQEYADAGKTNKQLEFDKSSSPASGDPITL